MEPEAIEQPKRREYRWVKREDGTWWLGLFDVTVEHPSSVTTVETTDEREE